MTDNKSSPTQIHNPQTNLKAEVTQKVVEAMRATSDLAKVGAVVSSNHPPNQSEGVTTKKITLKELGPRLPLGILRSDGTYAKDIAVRPWRMKEERELGALRDANRDANVAQYVGMILSTMCSKLGHYDFTKLSKLEERRVIIGQMFMGDVFYAYLWLRITALGPHLDLNLTCPNCTCKFPFVVDLESTEVTIAENLDDARWEYELKMPFKIRGKDVKAFTIGPARWNGLEMMESDGGGRNTGAAKAGIIQASIHGIPEWLDSDGKPQVIMLVADELDEMGKRDIEALTTFIDDHVLGPNMAIEDKCKRCGRQFRLPIDWGYDSFFGDSSD